MLRSGADDYLAKPFAYEEVVARQETVCRGYNRRCASLQVANLVFDSVRRKPSSISVSKHRRCVSLLC
jgi:DNA-binding response OmpR family regulator